MINNSKKKYSLGIATIVLGVFLLFFGRTSAQVVATNSSQNGGVCRMLASQTENVYALQNAVSGNINAITGNYNVNLSCDPADSKCQSLSAALNAALDAGNLINGFPQYVDKSSIPSNNAFNIVLGADPSVCGTRADGSVAGACAQPIQTPQGVNVGIYVNASSSQGQEILSNPAELTCVVEHEMSHGFGLDDTYNYLAGDQGLMGSGCNQNSPATWQADPLAVAAIKQINAAGGASSSIGCQQYTCPYGFTNIGTSFSQSGHVSCVQTSCTAAQLARGLVSNLCDDGSSPSDAGLCADGSFPQSCGFLPLLPPQDQTTGCTNQQLSLGYVNSVAGDCTSPIPVFVSNTGCTTNQLASGNYFNDPTAPGGCRQNDHVVKSTICGVEGYPDCPTTTQKTCYDDNGYVIACSSDTSPTSTTSELCTDGSAPDASGFCADGATSDYCNTNPTDPNCVDYCASNPTDSSCIGTNNPVNDPDFCTNNPTDPSCSINDTGEDDGDGSGQVVTCEANPDTIGFFCFNGVSL